MGIIEYLAKGRNKLTGLAGQKEKTVQQPAIQTHKLGKKKLPNSAGTAALKTPKFGQVAGGIKKVTPKPSGTTQAGPKMGNVLGHGSFLPNFFKRGMRMEFKTATGESGVGRIRDWGKIGVQLVSDTGKILHLHHKELVGQEKKEDKGKK